ncbi:MAG: ECF transporter S component [Eubacteriales bacterium]|nr:ECF transporter S component [Eubacteriales bacterium]
MKTTRWISFTGIGIALFVVFTMCLQVPVFENYYLCIGYIVMAVYCSTAGGLSGAAVGTLGVILYCVLTGGLRGMPGWAAGNVLIGLLLGAAFAVSRRARSRAVRYMICAIAVIIACAGGILGVKSITESILYAQPFGVRVLKNSYAFVADAAVLLASLPLCGVISRYAAAHSPFGAPAE